MPHHHQHLQLLQQPSLALQGLQQSERACAPHPLCSACTTVHLLFHPVKGQATVVPTDFIASAQARLYYTSATAVSSVATCSPALWACMRALYCVQPGMLRTCSTIGKVCLWPAG
jgi:hypothetical protein